MRGINSKVPLLIVTGGAKPDVIVATNATGFCVKVKLPVLPEVFPVLLEGVPPLSLTNFPYADVVVQQLTMKRVLRGYRV